MDNSWDNYEPSPIEFMHGRLMDEFHKWRKQITDDTVIEIDGIQFSNIVVSAKKATYEKYASLGLDKAVLKSLLLIADDVDPHEASKVKCDLCEYEWIAVRPEGLTKLECPNCHNMVNFENI